MADQLIRGIQGQLNNSLYKAGVGDFEGHKFSCEINTLYFCFPTP